MADLPVLPVTDYGQLLSSYDLNEAQAANANAQASRAPLQNAETLMQMRSQMLQNAFLQAKIASATTPMPQLDENGNFVSGTPASPLLGGGAPAAASPASATPSAVAAATDAAPGIALAPGAPGYVPTKPDGTPYSSEPDPTHVMGHSEVEVAANMDQRLHDTFSVNTAMTPAERASLALAQQRDQTNRALGIPSTLTENALKNYELRVANQTSRRQLATQTASDNIAAYVNSKEPFLTFAAIHPEQAKLTAEAAGFDVDTSPGAKNLGLSDDQIAELDAHTQKYGAMAWGKLFQYTGDKIGADGRVSRTGANPLAGSGIEALTAEQANTLGIKQQEANTAQWEAQKDEYGNQFAVNKVTGEKRPLGSLPSNSTTTGGNIISAATAGGGAGGASTAGVARGGTAAGGAGAPSPVQEPWMRSPIPQIPQRLPSDLGPTITSARIQAAGKANDARSDSLGETAAAAENAINYESDALAKSRAGQNVDVGPGSEYRDFARRMLVATGMAPDSVEKTLANDTELRKESYNAATQKFRQNFGGSGARPTQLEFLGQSTKGAPNPDQQKRAYEFLLQEDIAEQKYTKNLSALHNAYVNRGGSDSGWQGWIGTNYDKAAFVRNQFMPPRLPAGPAADAIYARLPPGYSYIGPDGKAYTKPVPGQ